MLFLLGGKSKLQLREMPQISKTAIDAGFDPIDSRKLTKYQIETSA